MHKITIAERKMPNLCKQTNFDSVFLKLQVLFNTVTCYSNPTLNDELHKQVANCRLTGLGWTLPDHLS